MYEKDKKIPGIPASEQPARPPSSDSDSSPVLQYPRHRPVVGPVPVREFEIYIFNAVILLHQAAGCYENCMNICALVTPAAAAAAGQSEDRKNARYFLKIFS